MKPSKPRRTTQAVRSFAFACLLVSLVGVEAQEGPRPEITPAGMVHPSVRLATPLLGSEPSSPLRIVGEARGTWYFEASFAIRLLGPDGDELGVAVAQAQAPWMTEDFVPFEAELSFAAPTDACLTLVLEKANPSDLPEHDDEVRIGLGCVLEK